MIHVYISKEGKPVREISGVKSDKSKKNSICKGHQILCFQLSGKWTVQKEVTGNREAKHMLGCDHSFLQLSGHMTIAV